MKILITGTAGFIGFSLVKSLVEEGHTIIGLDNINSYYYTDLKFDRLKELGIPKKDIKENIKIKSLVYPNYDFVFLNLKNNNALESLFRIEQFDIVVHLAAQAGVRHSITHPRTYIESNVIGFYNVLELCRTYTIKHLIYASSSSIYGNSKKELLSEEDRVDNPISLYAASKKSNELMAHTYSHLYNLKTTGLRFFTVYGPWGRPDMAYYLFTKAIIDKQPIKVFNQGNLQRDFTFIDDIIQGIQLIIEDRSIERKANYKIYNIGNSKPVNLLDFIVEIENVVGQVAEKEWLPMQAGDVQSTYADITALQADYGYQPTTSIQEGIKKFYDWYVNYHKQTIINRERTTT